jgi:hypothetical protein
MAKSLCKYRRVEIADQFANISKIVRTPNFVCSSCARSASSKDYLCKPSALKKAASLAPVPKEAPAPIMASETERLGTNVRPLPALPAVARTQLDAVATVEQESVALLPAVTKKQVKRLKKLAKKKNKRLKKAAKAVKRYEKALQKTKKALKL